MAKFELHAKALKMRKKGMSYSQIKREIGVSKSTLSVWLQGMPLPEERLRELRDNSEVRIEKYRETRRKTRESRWDEVLSKAALNIGTMTERELFLAGLFLYWGEGSKTEPMTTSLSNTDPTMLKLFIAWLELLGARKERLRIYVHLYSDMNIEEELGYWSRTLDIPRTSFREPYIKKSTRAGITYPQKFTHGTCNILYHERDLTEYVLMSLKYVRSLFAGELQV